MPATIAPAELREFVRALDYARLQRAHRPIWPQNCIEPTDAIPRNPSYFWHHDTGGLIVSFDAEWQPFLCNHRRRNEPEDRWYLPPCSLLERVGKELRAQFRHEPIGGGRVILFSDCVVAARRESWNYPIVLQWTLGAPCAYLKPFHRVSSPNFPVAS